MKEEKFFWQRDYRKPKDFTVWEILIIRLEIKCAPYLTRLTRYFPFSLLWRERRFHYKFKEVTETVDRIKKIAATRGFWFDLFFYERDERFLIIYGQFDWKKKKIGNVDELFAHFQKLYENENSYIIPLEEERAAKFVFVRNIDGQ